MYHILYIHFYIHTRTPGVLGFGADVTESVLTVCLSDDAMFGPVPMPPRPRSSGTGSRRRHPAGSQETTTDV